MCLQRSQMICWRSAGTQLVDAHFDKRDKFTLPLARSKHYLSFSPNKNIAKILQQILLILATIYIVVSYTRTRLLKRRYSLGNIARQKKSSFVEILEIVATLLLTELLRANCIELPECHYSYALRINENIFIAFVRLVLLSPSLIRILCACVEHVQRLINVRSEAESVKERKSSFRLFCGKAEAQGIFHNIGPRLEVCVLHAGPSVTTAPSHHLSHRNIQPALLAAFLFFLASLTIVARYYASTALFPHPQQLVTPIPSAFPTTHKPTTSSSLVLSKIVQSLFRGDTSLILTNYAGRNKRELTSHGYFHKFKKNYEYSGHVNEPISTEELQKKLRKISYSTKIPQDLFSSDEGRIKKLTIGKGHATNVNDERQLLFRYGESLINKRLNLFLNTSAVNNITGFNSSQVIGRVQIDGRIFAKKNTQGENIRKLITQRPMLPPHDHPLDICKYSYYYIHSPNIWRIYLL